MANYFRKINLLALAHCLVIGCLASCCSITCVDIPASEDASPQPSKVLIEVRPEAEESFRPASCAIIMGRSPTIRVTVLHPKGKEKGNRLSYELVLDSGLGFLNPRERELDQ